MGKIITQTYGNGVSGHAVLTTKLRDCKIRYNIVSDLIKLMDRGKQ